MILWISRIRDSSIRCAWNRQVTKNWNQSWRFRRTWKHRSRMQISESQFHGQYMMKMSGDSSSTDSHTENYTAARNFTWSTIKLAHLVFITLDHPNEAMIQFTWYQFIIAIISYSSLQSSNTKWIRTLTNAPGLLNCAIFSISFAYFASVGEIVLVEWLKRRTLISLPW